MLALLLQLLGPIGIALVVIIPALIVVATVITRRESIRAQLCSDVMRDRREPVQKEV
jgi:hypothetical protein